MKLASCLVILSLAPSAFAQVIIFEGDLTAEAAWRAAAGGNVPIETFERFRGTPFGGTSDIVPGLPALGIIFETFVPGTYLGVYSDAPFAHSGANQIANFGGGMAQFSSFRIRPEDGKAIYAFGFWQCDPQGDQPMLAYDASDHLIGTIIGHINDHTGHGFAGFVSSTPIARIEVPGNLGDGYNHMDDFQALTLPLCIADYNNDGGVDGADVQSFFQDWEGGNSAADVNRDGGVDGADVQYFFERWEGGC